MVASRQRSSNGFVGAPWHASAPSVAVVGDLLALAAWVASSRLTQLGHPPREPSGPRTCSPASQHGPHRSGASQAGGLVNSGPWTASAADRWPVGGPPRQPVGHPVRHRHVRRGQPPTPPRADLPSRQPPHRAGPPCRTPRPLGAVPVARQAATAARSCTGPGGSQPTAARPPSQIRVIYLGTPSGRRAPAPP